MFRTKYNRILDWNNHVSKITNKLATGLFLLRKLSKFNNFQTIKSIYFSLKIDLLHYTKFLIIKIGRCLKLEY